MTGATATKSARGWYVYGILPADAELAGQATGIGATPSPLQLISTESVAALVSEVDLPSLGTPDDLVRHQRLLDEVARDVPVLPFRFGAVLADREAITEKLLVPHGEDFLTALAHLTGRTEYLVRARYVLETVLREILVELPDAGALQQRIQAVPADASRDMRIKLGEIVSTAIQAKRQADTHMMIGRLAPHCVDVAEREPAHEEDAANVALLVDVAKVTELKRVVKNIAQEWNGRVQVRLAGPLAAYDFALHSAAGADSPW